jgi:hypothetical protein
MKAGKLCPTCILGVRITSADGTIWGVVVMDSSNQYECIDTEDKSFKAAWTKLRNRLISLGALT